MPESFAFLLRLFLDKHGDIITSKKSHNPQNLIMDVTSLTQTSSNDYELSVRKKLVQIGQIFF